MTEPRNTLATTTMSVATGTAALVALDVDGTLLDRDQQIPPQTIQALDLARACGHHIVLATGRSLTGVLSVAERLGLTDGWVVASNGALTVRLDPAAPTGYSVDHARTFDPAPAIRRALDLEPEIQVAVEEVGWGWRVGSIFEPGLLNGDQKLATIADLCAQPVTRLAVHGPEVRRWVDTLAAIGVTVTPAGPDWLDVTSPGTSKATALEAVREHLGVPAARTVAVGDGINDIPMLAWAGRGLAMGHAPAIVRDSADEVTGSIAENGVVSVLRSLVPADLDETSPDTPLSPLVRQLAAALATAPGPAVVRVWHGLEPDLAGCEVWTLHAGTWVRHAPIPAATGVMMRDVENGAHHAGLDYPSGDVGRRRARWRTVSSGPARPAGFELPLHRI